VALELGRRAVLIELNPEYCRLIRERCGMPSKDGEETASEASPTTIGFVNGLNVEKAS
jgi:hypothetical protein